jgi:AbrB family looped-hinge helix DNA binding protein
MTRKILQIGSSVGVTIPKSILDKFGLEVGDEVEIETDDESGDLRIRPHKQADDREGRIARRTMNFIDRYRDDLEALADK